MSPLMASKDHKAREAAQRRAVRKRDTFDGVPRCRFERRTVVGWVECIGIAQDTAHIIRRVQCGAVWDSPDVAIRACRECHTAYDNYETTVRVPYKLAKKAWDLVVAASKVPPPAHYNPDVSEVYKGGAA